MMVYIIQLTHDFPSDGFQLLGAFDSREKAKAEIDRLQPQTTLLQDGSFCHTHKRFWKVTYDYFAINEFEVK